MKPNYNPWTREQLIIALNLYCKIPFNKVASQHPEIIRIANIIGRTPNSVKMKIGNFGSFDPELKSRGIVGLGNTSKLDEQIWNEFNTDWENLAFESENLISQLTNRTIEEIAEIETDDIPIGIDRKAIIKQRVNQSFFRKTILSSYNTQCCITGISIPQLLFAAHIIPWADDKQNRLNPHNGLCLSIIHEKAFDKGFFTITSDNYKVRLSPFLKEFISKEIIYDLFYKYENKQISLPDRFVPSREFLEHHNSITYKRWNIV